MTPRRALTNASVCVEPNARLRDAREESGFFTRIWPGDSVFPLQKAAASGVL